MQLDLVFSFVGALLLSFFIKNVRILFKRLGSKSLVLSFNYNNRYFSVCLWNDSFDSGKGLMRRVLKYMHLLMTASSS